nr:reverse transcriptase domain-containing protein [Tanacetum cinerariifolium]
MNKPSGSGSLPSNNVSNSKGDLKAITTRSGVSYYGPLIPPPFSPPPKVVERGPDVTKDLVQPSTKKFQPPNVQTQAPTIESVNTPKPNLPYPSRLNNQKLREKDDHQMMNNKEKLFELANTPVNENFLAVILKNLPKKLGDLGKFLIPCKFPKKVECLALADLGASINLMPLSIWRKLSLPELTPTHMILELADRSTTIPTGIAEDVFVKVGKFHFSANFVVVDYVVGPRVPLILRRPFLRMTRALINVYGKELTLRVSDEAITFKVGNTSRFYGNFESGNPTPTSEPIVAKSSPSLTPFKGGDFILEEIEAYLASDSVPSRIDDAEFDPEGDIRLIKEILNNDPYSPLPSKDLKCEELKSVKSSVDEPWSLNSRTYLLISIQHQRRVNLKIHEVIKKEVVKLLDAGLIYPISDSPWVSLVHCVPKKGGMIIVTNENNELIPTRLVIGWKVCIDYRKLNDATRKDHLPLPFMDQMLEQLAGNEYYCFLDGFSGYFQMPIDPQDQEKTTFTCPYGTFAYRRMPFGLCNAPGTFQRCMTAIIHDMIKKTIEVFMDDFSEKCHFIVKEGIVLGHKILKSGIEVDREKVDVIAKLPHHTSVKGIQSFLGHVGFYRRFIQDFSKITQPMTNLLEKETPFIFSTKCREAFKTLKKKLIEASILVAPDWDLPFEIMCDASDFVVGAVLGQRKTKHFQPIHYASKTMTDAQAHYTTTKKELLAVVYDFEKFLPYLVLSKTIVYTDHSALKYLLAKQDAKPRLLCWILHL